MFTKLLAVLPLIALAAAAPLEKKQHGVEVINTCYVSGTVALTFDDGPHDYEMDIARTLGDSKGTFFLNGNNWNCIYNRIDEVRELHRQGHTLASHTWSHPDLTTLNWDGINYELERLEEAFIRILGVKPLYFRPPYGRINDLVLQVLGSRGYKKVFMWSEDSGDTRGQGAGPGREVMDKVANSYPQPHNILLHSVQSHTAYDITPYGVDRLRNAGYRMVSVDACLGDSGEWPYEWVGEPGTPDGSWTC